jgi:NADH-quinone oxidoreductase subunit A
MERSRWLLQVLPEKACRYGPVWALRRAAVRTRARIPNRNFESSTLVDLSQYLPILIFLVIALGLSAVIVFLPIGVSYLTGAHNPDSEKLSEYECGFPAFEDPRSQFDVRFYLVAILFIIFDLEAAFLFPWAVSLDLTGWPGWITMMVFLGELAVGLAYAWKKGALDWE